MLHMRTSESEGSREGLLEAWMILVVTWASGSHLLLALTKPGGMQVLSGVTFPLVFDLFYPECNPVKFSLSPSLLEMGTMSSEGTGPGGARRSHTILL